MATRAKVKRNNSLHDVFGVPATKTATEGQRVKFSGADNLVENCGANEAGIGIAQATVVGSASNPPVEVILDGYAVERVKVGTGGATRGLYAKSTADGFTDQAIADGTTPRFIAGMFMQSGVVGDYVGMLLGVPTPLSTA